MPVEGGVDVLFTLEQLGFTENVARGSEVAIGVDDHFFFKFGGEKKAGAADKLQNGWRLVGFLEILIE